MKRSKLQSEVLGLYRRFLRFSLTLETAEARKDFYTKAQHEFRKNASVSRMQISFIEFKLRHGEQLMSMLEESRPHSFTQF